MSSDSSDAFNKDYALSLEDPAAFWGSAAEEIDWTKKPGMVLETSESPHGRWFIDGELNTCLLYTSPSPRDLSTSRMPSSA